MNAYLEGRRDAIAAFCRKWKIAELAVFGSVLRNHFGPDSDVDVLVRFDPAARHGLSEWMETERELAEILGQEVDLISRQAVEWSDNYIRRKAILGSAQVLYARVTMRRTCWTCWCKRAMRGSSCQV